jgi:hypothetical protein
MNPARSAAQADVWEKVVMKLRGGMMPPQGMPRPDEPTLERLPVSLEHTLGSAGARARQTRLQARASSQSH